MSEPTGPHHGQDDQSRSDIHRLTGTLEQARGVIGRYPGPGEQYIFEFDEIGYRPIHMLGVFDPLQVTWLQNDEVVKQRVLSPVIGFGIAKADTVVERQPLNSADRFSGY